jgi:hypothetical protein
VAYKAIVTRVYTRPHPNADRIQLGEARGYQVIVGTDVEDGTLGVLFPPDGQLSHEFCMANNLYNRDPETGEKMGGFFDKNRRVRAQKFRGEKSEAYWTTLESFEYLGLGAFSGDLVEGEEFDSLNGHAICQKYETPATKRAQANQANRAKRQVPNFHKHFDTDQLRKSIDEIPEGALLYFTEKLHGTSQRSAYVTVDRDDLKLTWRQRLGHWISGLPVKAVISNEHLLGTRNVILGRHEGKSFYGDEGFRYRHHDRIKDRLHLGETVYYEVVGFTGGDVRHDEYEPFYNAKPIMPAVKTDALKDHRVMYRGGENLFPYIYGETMYYTYGNWEADSPASPRAMGGSEIYVYRITQQNAQGIPLDLSWEQVKGRCEELGVPHVPEVHPPRTYVGRKMVDWGDISREGLQERAEDFAAGPSTLDPTHIREGVCVRWEKGKKMGILKHKSFEFLVLEGVVKTDENYVDMEESS